jgi:hypothetical protein
MLEEKGTPETPQGSEAPKSLTKDNNILSLSEWRIKIAEKKARRRT